MIENKNIKHIEYWKIPQHDLHVEDVIFDTHGNLLEASVINGSWLLKFNGTCYDACYHDGAVVNGNIYNNAGAIHYTNMKPCNDEGIQLSDNQIKTIVTKSTYPYQPGKTLVATIESYQKCLVDGSDGNIDYLYKKLLEQAESADKITNTFTNTSF